MSLLRTVNVEFSPPANLNQGLLLSDCPSRSDEDVVKEALYITVTDVNGRVGVENRGSFSCVREEYGLTYRQSQLRTFTVWPSKRVGKDGGSSSW